MRHSERTISRRDVLRTGAGVAVASLVPAAVLGRAAGAVAASERVTLAVVGLGSRGYNLIDQFTKNPNARIVAACDVDRFHYRDRPWGSGTAHGRDPGKARIDAAQGDLSPGVDVVSDYREICDRDDVDAVIVATPDHWHGIMAVDAMKAGKDVYCEKPLAHTFAEGLAICREAAARKAIFQTGSQQRSDHLFRRAVQLVRGGYLGKINRIEVGLSSGYAEPQGDTTVTEPPETLDYDFWCGPAPKLPYMRARHHRWWRGHRAFGGGVLMDWIGHHHDIAQWSLEMDAGGPTKVEAVGWTYPETEVYNTPEHYEIVCDYPGGVVCSISDKHRGGTLWIGEKGKLFVTRGKIAASDDRLVAPDFDPGQDVYTSDDHAGNFLDCVRSRRACIAPAEAALRSITPGLLGYVSDELSRPLRWNGTSLRIEGDDEASALLHQLSLRKPWTLA